MTLTDKHIEAIRTAAASVDFGKITITAGTDNHLDIIIERRIRLPKEGEKEQEPTRITGRNNRPRH